MKRIKGGITSPLGFKASALHCGIKKRKLDLALILSELPAASAGSFTANKFKAAPVLLSKSYLAARETSRAVIINSGNANCLTGKQGSRDAALMTGRTASLIGCKKNEVLVCSTGIIGKRLPIDKIDKALPSLVSGLSKSKAEDSAKAILTTDTHAKEIAVSLDLGDCKIAIGGIVKGSGMICPNLATMLCFLTTDAAVENDFLQTVLRNVVDNSLNMLNIDNDTSTNDTVILLANGTSGNEIIRAKTREAQSFQQALSEVCYFLTKELARDAEGATKLIEVTVEGAMTVADARDAAHTIVGSSLVKTAIHGADPNWGRILAALGRSKAEITASKIDLHVADICLIKAGRSMLYDLDELRAKLGSDEVIIKVCLNMGNRAATAWGCDLSEEYVTINSQYTT